jgi:hypothetical protein
VVARRLAENSDVGVLLETGGSDDVPSEFLVNGFSLVTVDVFD